MARSGEEDCREGVLPDNTKNNSFFFAAAAAAAARNVGREMRRDFFADLPAEMVARIFLHLCERDLVLAVGGVSRRFRALSTHNITAVKSMKNWRCNDDITAFSMEPLLSSLRPFMPGWCLQVRLHPPVVWMKSFLLRCSSRLRKLLISTDLLTMEEVNDVIIFALEHCQVLEELTFGQDPYVFSEQSTPTNRADLWRAIKNHGQSLKKLHVYHNTPFLDASALKGLTHIHLSVVRALEGQTLLAIGEECKSLSSFRLHGPSGGGKKNGPSGEVVDRFLQSVKDTLKEISWDLSCQKSLSCFSVLGQCQSLESVKLYSEYDPIGLDVICKVLRLPLLRELDFQSFEQNLTSCFSRKNLDNLRVLRILSPALDRDCVTAIADSCPGLTELALDNWYYKKMTEACVEKIAGGKWAKSLEKVSLLNVGFEMSTVTMRDVLETLPNLKNVEIFPVNSHVRLGEALEAEFGRFHQCR